MLMYRVESMDQGFGPYQGDAFDVMCMWGGGVCHPTPYDDRLLKKSWSKVCTDHLYFGFDGLKQLKRWFYSETMRADVAECGYWVAVYDVANVEHYVGEAQMVADIQVIAPLKYLDLITLKEIDNA